MKMKFIYVFLACLMIGSQLGLAAQNQTDKDKNRKKRQTPEQLMERQTNQMVRTLMLDDAATAKFVPVYQSYLKELRECRMMNASSPRKARKRERRE